MFRDERYQLLTASVPVTFIVSAAPNTGQLAQRVLAVAVQSGVDDFVLGAWGCGVFGNSPADVARAFATHLRPAGRCASAFDRVVFAVYERSRDRATLAAFRAVFG
ncbi:MAG TPA: TIGR02452 family protein [Pseudonocardiaceae bacterium]